ncbi:polysaccharide biosynthesis tyrosine autokinase [Yeosuana sp. MJ-SS3]|uniref:non-specific protein-tyrosine kinase n=1 Tax=Gilvirhabdus luticola TaxID=3079858 RepID=A0ABU3U7R4_9FLAO|nr:polysaccharide biosynthesis tyrosine autokinase [Yeosuana sp. MJ-SS3]MDU8886155.1 polysaccharide biosynthesis tyrosine autokinase [Yeosuana sp. MJ-SS3]
MAKNTTEQKEYFRDIIDVYLLRWKFIAFCTVVALVLAFLYLRYADYQYRAIATIKITDDKSKNKLPEISNLQNYGLFKTDLNNVIDEIEVLKSRALITEVVKDLKFNVQCFVEGRIKAVEIYTNPPLNINFSASDSIIHKVDTTFSIKIKSPTSFLFKGIDKKSFAKKGKEIEEDGVVYNFGESIETGFGDIIITPNIGQYAAKIDSNIKIKISPLNSVSSFYKSKLLLETKETSSVIKLTINDNLKEKGKLFLNKLIEKYNQDVVKDKQLVVKTTSDFINNRLEVVSRELEEVDLTAESLQQKNKLTDLQTQSDIFLQTEKENENKLINTANQIQLIDYMNEYLKNSSSDLLPANIGIADGSIDQITKRHNELVLERNRILKNSSEINPTVINLNNQIDAIKQNLDQSLNNVKSTNQITLDNLYAENSRINSQIFSAPKKERQFRDIKRQQDIKEALYLYLLQKREESAISLGVTSSNAKIIDPAFASSKPVSPKKVIIILAALLLGLGIPIGLIYILNLMDTKVHTYKDVKQIIDIPYIGEIPKATKKSLLISEIDYSPKAEAFRIIRTNLEFMLQGIKNRSRTIFVTSTTNKEGKSHTSTNLALSLSYSKKKVLIIEADIRVPKTTTYLNIKNDIGLTNFISDTDLKSEDIIKNVNGNDYLDIITAGAIPPNPSELLMSDRVQLLFDDVKSKYDYIIVDTAAVGLVTDSLLISKYADMFIYVVKANYLDKRQLYVAQNMYNEKRLPNMAVLVNYVNFKKGLGYAYGYGKNPNKSSKKWWKFS